jgi:hypothetical protein
MRRRSMHCPAGRKEAILVSIKIAPVGAFSKWQLFFLKGHVKYAFKMIDFLGCARPFFNFILFLIIFKNNP